MREAQRIRHLDRDVPWAVGCAGHLQRLREGNSSGAVAQPLRTRWHPQPSHARPAGRSPQTLQAALSFVAAGESPHASCRSGRSFQPIVLPTGPAARSSQPIFTFLSPAVSWPYDEMSSQRFAPCWDARAAAGRFPPMARLHRVAL